MRFLPAGLVVMAMTAAACSPTFNWREVRPEATPLKAMMPCKPDKAVRPVPMAGRTVELRALGCEAGGATFAVLAADIGDAARTGETLAQWQAATLANLKAGQAQSQPQPFVPPRAAGLRESVRVSAQGRRQDGSDVRSEAAYFARGTQVFQAVIYAGEIKPEWSDSFFGGLAFE